MDSKDIKILWQGLALVAIMLIVVAACIVTMDTVSKIKIIEATCAKGVK